VLYAVHTLQDMLQSICREKLRGTSCHCRHEEKARELKVCGCALPCALAHAVMR